MNYLLWGDGKNMSVIIRIAMEMSGHPDCFSTCMTNILLIEDNEVDRFIAERQLALSGLDASMQSVTNGRSALDLLLLQYSNTGLLPDLILVDDFMPVMNGLDFIHAFEQADIAGKEYVRIFLLTSFAGPARHLDPAFHRLTGIVEKPMTTEHLKQVVLTASNHPRSIKTV